MGSVVKYLSVLEEENARTLVSRVPSSSRKSIFDRETFFIDAVTFTKNALPTFHTDEIFNYIFPFLFIVIQIQLNYKSEYPLAILYSKDYVNS